MLVEDDTLGSTYHNNTQKLEIFDQWLQGQVNSEILTTDGFGNPWIKKYTDAAYTKGIVRAYSDVQRLDPNRSIDFVLGAKEQFRKMLVVRPDIQGRMDILVTRALEELKGLANYAILQLNILISSNMIQGTITTHASDRNRRLAKIMAKRLRLIAKRRAARIAQDAMVRAQAEGQLDSFDAQGIEKVSLYATWTTVGDEKVCPLCLPLDGVQFTIEEARGIIPRHFGCRCAWAPGGVKAGHNRTRTVRRRLTDSILAECKQSRKKTKAERVRQARRESVWVGKDLLLNQIKKLKNRVM